ncbi:DUF2264 domain-containing protein [Metabacillus malikii]|uniref:DUF2264 domain-containing protein n=1 Tax=Metabacillus malikii TaxID=1504265 RepID=A0ABT9ZC79_9BACI|nr:DUF2264 domain-containing protein [Metabacillus malikii]MDQ0229870.1 hypothetical protein [Metabacillus malikii]
MQTISSNKLKTREEVRQALKQIVEQIKPHYSKGHAILKLGNNGSAFSDKVAGMEGFSRILWGLAPMLAGEDEEYDIWDHHIQGIKNGTNRQHEEYWGELNDYDQRSVEMAVFGLALLLIPHKLWDPLSSDEKQNLSEWLQQINRVEVHDCNWLFFPILVNLGLKHVGEPYSSSVIERNLTRIDEFYLGNGWYEDGINGHADYYGPFAIHFYSLIYAKYMEREDPLRAKRYKQRAEQFAQEFIYWFASDGSAIPYGRSLTYRFAQSAFWSAAVFAGISPFSLGVMKGIILRNLRYWFRQPIFNEQGILTVGYHYQNLIMAENYNSSGSPYWALKTFLPLALATDDPFWLAEEEPLPPLKNNKIQNQPHMVLCRNKSNNHILAFNTGHPTTNEHTHTSAKYEKFVYSNVFGFSVPRAEWGLGQGAFDSTLAVSEGDNLYRVKRTSTYYEIAEHYMLTKWNPWTDVNVKTWIVPGNPWHIRIHCIQTNRALHTAEGGFALGLEEENYPIKRDENGCFVENKNAQSGVVILHGTGTSTPLFPNANTNILHQRTVIPTIQTEVPIGETWLAHAVYGNMGTGTDVESYSERPKLTINENRIEIHLLKGEPPILIDMKG